MVASLIPPGARQGQAIGTGSGDLRSAGHSAARTHDLRVRERLRLLLRRQKAVEPFDENCAVALDKFAVDTRYAELAREAIGPGVRLEVCGYVQELGQQVFRRKCVQRAFGEPADHPRFTRFQGLRQLEKSAHCVGFAGADSEVFN